MVWSQAVDDIESEPENLEDEKEQEAIEMVPVEEEEEVNVEEPIIVVMMLLKMKHSVTYKSLFELCLSSLSK